MKEFILIAIILISILSFASIVMNVNEYRHYKRVYKQLPYRKFYRNFGHVYCHAYNEKDNGFVWFCDENSFCLDGKVYLHNNLVTFLDPFSFYWLCKYQRWFRKNVIVNQLPNY